MELAGYFASVLIGILLGLVGGGGSIFMVPVLVYLFKTNAMLATTYSLFIVGITSIAGSLSYFMKKLINFRTAFFFGIPSIVSVLVTRMYVVPAIPETIMKIGGFAITGDFLLLLFFAFLMIFVSLGMIRKNHDNDELNETGHVSLARIVVQGLGVGLVTGLVGVGGGFLIVPALTGLLKLSMKTAVGTSLFIIAINSLAGFFSSRNQEEINWQLLLTISVITIIGVLAGSFLSTRIDGKKLRPAFGWFVLVVGIYILVKETFLK